MDKTNIPIIFIHKGYSSYLEYSLRQAKYTNPDSEIILLGDEANNRFPFITHVNIKDYFTKATEFAKIYKHYSTNPYNYELFCFQRWFILQEFLHTKSYNEIFVCDSDVLLYCSIHKVLIKNYPNIDVGLMYAPMGLVSAGISYWKLPHLSTFCNIIFNSCANTKTTLKFWRKFTHTNYLCMSDMVAVSEYFRQYRKTINFSSLIFLKSNQIFDININLSGCSKNNEFEYKKGKKKFVWKNKIPYSFNYDLNKYIKFNCIHFQGAAKYLIASFYTGKTFHKMHLLCIQFYILNITALLYKIFRLRSLFVFIRMKTKKK